MDIRTLQEAFNAVFHNKESFADFCSIQASEHIEEFYVGKRYVKATDPFYLEKLQGKYGALALRRLMEDRWRDD